MVLVAESLERVNSLLFEDVHNILEWPESNFELLTDYIPTIVYVSIPGKNGGVHNCFYRKNVWIDPDEKPRDNDLSWIVQKYTEPVFKLWLDHINKIGKSN